MVMVLARNWWALVLRGFFDVLFGITAFVWPGITLAVLVLLYGAFALVDGSFAIAAVLVGRTRGMPSWALLVEGLAGIAVGAITFFWPGITAARLAFPDRGLGRRHGRLRDRRGRTAPQGDPRRTVAGLERGSIRRDRRGLGRQSRRRALGDLLDDRNLRDHLRRPLHRSRFPAKELAAARVVHRHYSIR